VVVVVTGPGMGRVTSMPAGIDCPGTCEVPAGQGVWTLTAEPIGTSVFTGWSGGGCLGTELTCQPGIRGETVIEARFEGMTHTLAVERVGQGSGRVRANGLALDCGDTCSVTLADGAVVTLEAIADPGSLFTGWTDDICPATPQSCQVTVTADTTLHARFAQEVPLTVILGGNSMGYVGEASPMIRTLCSGPTTSCTQGYAPGTTVTLGAAPYGGVRFAGWSGDCVGTGECSVTLDVPRSVTAVFLPGP
jgi:hypothetical protein